MSHEPVMEIRVSAGRVLFRADCACGDRGIVWYSTEAAALKSWRSHTESAEVSSPGAGGCGCGRAA